MVNKNFCMGILIMVLAFGMTVIGCNNDPDNGNGNINGTWILTERNDIFGMTFNNGNYEGSTNGHPTVKGIYTINGDKITSTLTHINGDFFKLGESKWYTKDESPTQYHVMFTTETGTYSINGDTLTFIDENGETVVWKRK